LTSRNANPRKNQLQQVKEEIKALKARRYELLDKQESQGLTAGEKQELKDFQEYGC